MTNDDNDDDDNDYRVFFGISFECFALFKLKLMLFAYRLPAGAEMTGGRSLTDQCLFDLVWRVVLGVNVL